MKHTLTILAILATTFCFGQKLHHISHDAPIDKKLNDALRYTYTLTSADSSDYQIEIFFTGSYSMVKKGYSSYYKLYNSTGEEIYKSEEWKVSGTGSAAENYMVKKTIKDLKKQLK